MVKKMDKKPEQEKETRAGEVKEKDLEKLLTEKDEQIASYIDRLQRLQAEFENYKKRTLREMAGLEERIVDREILDFLSLYDNLERAFENLSGDNNVEAFVQGIERIFAQFDQILKAKGVSPIEAVGTRFDPNRHEALLSVPSEEERNTILEEFERGYLRHDRVLRPSKVKVSSGKEEDNKEGEP